MRRTLALAVVALVAIWPASAAAEAETEGAGLEIQTTDVSQHPRVSLTISLPSASAAASPNDIFTVEEDGEVRAVKAAKVADSALEVVLVMDTTGSMSGEPIAAARASATAFLEGLPPDAYVAILSYDDTPHLLSPLSTDRADQLAAIAGLEAQGRTALYDTLGAAVDQLSGTPGSTRAVVLLTDGEDNASITPLPDLLDRLADAGAPLHVITYRTSFTDIEALAQMTAAAGGSARQADDPATLDRMYAEIMAQLTSQYTLEYVSESSGTTEVVVTAAVDGTALRTGLQLDLPVVRPAAITTPTPAQEPVAAPPEPTTRTVAVDLWTQPWVLLVGAGALFVALSVVFSLLLRPTARSQLSSGAGRHRGSTATLPALAGSAARAIEHGLGRRGRIRGLDARLEQAGVALRPGEYVLLLSAVALLALLLTGALVNPVVGVIVAAATVLSGKAVLQHRVLRRRAAFEDQLSDTLQMLASSLRSGHGLQQAIDAVAKEAERPTSDELRRVIVETRLGRDLSTCLDAMADRMASEDFEWVVQAVAIHRDVGGNLSEVLDQVSETIRDRNQVRRQVKVLSAEGRLSAIVLLAMPFAAFGALALINPEYIAELTTSTTGHMLIALAFVLMSVGAIWIRRLVRLVF